MSDYLDQLDFLKPFLIGSDSQFKSMGGCSRKRPDKLYLSQKLALWIECDEHQHNYNNGSYLCEEKRISDCFDEFQNVKLVVVRWNPHAYKTNTQRKNRQQRLRELHNLCEQIIKKPPKELIKVYYMYYDKDNPLICRNIPFEMIC